MESGTQTGRRYQQERVTRPFPSLRSISAAKGIVDTLNSCDTVIGTARGVVSWGRLEQ